MPFYLVVFNNYDAMVTIDNPYTLSDVRMSQPYEYHRDAQFALNAYRLGRDTAISTCNETVERETREFRETVIIQAEIIRKQNVEIEKLNAVTSSLKLSITGIRKSIETWFAAIAKDIVLGGTHRERNELYRAIARGMDTWLKFPHESADMDDIPF